ncbi:MAG: pyridoxamine 5'-phosphate oxidase family protein [Proteobacteria bacterium]|nr:pyridoxamine 5'-phosphate oxidase family protein [Pseudomonadota bacterium]MBU4009925.1 pyridoxamine 5'-phosphate oxidase family protein [Pseudomonadota bacterium]
MKEINELKELFNSQKLAVLATYNKNQPHGCLVAFASSGDLKHLLFATKRNTRKYNDIYLNTRVAMLIDNRSNRESDFEQAVAVTAKGSAREPDSSQRDKWKALYISKHPQLAAFVNNPDVVVIRIDVEEYCIAGFNSTHFIKL